MNIELTDKEFRRLLDLVYIGNWILNSTREKDRFEDYDILQEKLFAQCAKNGMNALISRWQGHIFPSPAYENGGIHEAIADYEDAVFFDILAEELARRDMSAEEICEAMIAYMPTVTVDGVTGVMTWNAAGEVSKTPYAAVIKDGAYVGADNVEEAQ